MKSHEFGISANFELEMFGLYINIPVDAAAEVTYESFAYHNGLGDLASAAKSSVELTSFKPDWDSVSVFDDESNSWATKVPPKLKDKIRAQLEIQVQAYAEMKAGSFARND